MQAVSCQPTPSTGKKQRSCHPWQEVCSIAELASQHPLVHLFSTGTHSKLPKYSTAALEEITSLHSRKMPVWQCGAMRQYQNRLNKQLITIKRSSLKKTFPQVFYCRITTAAARNSPSSIQNSEATCRLANTASTQGA